MKRRLAGSVAFALLLTVSACTPGTGESEFEAEEAQEESGALNEEISDTWSAGPGFGTAFRRANEGKDIAIFYGGYGATLTASQTWLDEAFTTELEARGVGRLYAVKGPLHSDYRDYEIGNSKIAKRLIGAEGQDAERIIIIAHSSGAFVANELMTQLADGRDTLGNAAQKVVYVNLDGAGGPPNKALQNLAGAWAVSVKDAAGTRSTNAWTAEDNGATYAAAGKGGHHLLLAEAGVCASGAKWCLHMFTTNQRPHNKWGLDVPNDYTDFDGNPIQLGFLAELGLVGEAGEDKLP